MIGDARRPIAGYRGRRDDRGPDVGLFLPLFWLIGALIPSTAETR